LAPNSFVITIGLAAILLSWRTVAGLVILAGGLEIWLYSSGIGQLAALRAANPTDLVVLVICALGLLTAIGFLVAFANYQVQRGLLQVRQQNAQLVAANRELAARSRHEHELGAD